MSSSADYCEFCGGHDHRGDCNKARKKKHDAWLKSIEDRRQRSLTRAPEIAERLMRLGYDAHVKHDSAGWAVVEVYCE
jgi:hypothetical protein